MSDHRITQITDEVDIFLSNLSRCGDRVLLHELAHNGLVRAYLEDNNGPVLAISVLQRLRVLSDLVGRSAAAAFLRNRAHHYLNL